MTLLQKCCLLKILQQQQWMEFCWGRRIVAGPSKSICSCDWHEGLHVSQALIPSVLWLWSIGICDMPRKCAVWLLLHGREDKNISTQSLLMWMWKLVDELLEYRVCTDKLLNFHWTCRLRIGSFSKRKIHQTTNNFSFTYLSEMFDLVRK